MATKSTPVTRLRWWSCGGSFCRGGLGEPGRPGHEVLLLGRARGAVGRGLVRGDRAAVSPAISSRWARTAARRCRARSGGRTRARRAASSPAARTVHHGDGDGAVERHHRVVRDALAARRRARGSAASRCPSTPAASSWTRGDRRLQLVGADRRRARAPRCTSVDALGDRRPVPAAAVLLGERDQLAVRAGARGAAGVGQQHQREQPGDLARRRAAAACSIRASRIASSERSARCSSAPLLLA